jgi:hypothetical protein
VVRINTIPGKVSSCNVEISSSFSHSGIHQRCSESSRIYSQIFREGTADYRESTEQVATFVQMYLFSVPGLFMLGRQKKGFPYYKPNIFKISDKDVHCGKWKFWSKETIPFY